MELWVVWTLGSMGKTVLPLGRKLALIVQILLEEQEKLARALMSENQMLITH